MIEGCGFDEIAVLAEVKAATALGWTPDRFCEAPPADGRCVSDDAEPAPYVRCLILGFGVEVEHIHHVAQSRGVDGNIRIPFRCERIW